MWYIINIRKQTTVKTN